MCRGMGAVRVRAADWALSRLVGSGNWPACRDLQPPRPPQALWTRHSAHQERRALHILAYVLVDRLRAVFRRRFRVSKVAPHRRPKRMREPYGACPEVPEQRPNWPQSCDRARHTSFVSSTLLGASSSFLSSFCAGRSSTAAAHLPGRALHQPARSIGPRARRGDTLLQVPPG